jgi:hypothetical protein
MRQRNRSPRRIGVLAAALVAMAIVVAACGSSSSSGSGSGGSGDAKTLLKQTFSQPHKVTSGDLNFSLTLSPGGSTTLKGPLTLSFGGPFQSQGTGKLPQSNFNISFNGFGKSGSLGIVSTGTNGFITLKGVSYRLPAATFKQLESSFSQFGGTTGSSSSGVLGSLGVDPLNWLTNPSVVGTEQVGGAQTTHIRAGINVGSLLLDLNTILQKASTLTGAAGASASALKAISAASRQRIASEIKNPKFDVWTGNSDKTIRKLAISLTLPVSGQVSTALGGLSSAGIALQVSYANLNQPQTITAPTNVHPFTEFATKIQALVQTIQSTVAGGLGGLGSTGSSSSAAPGSTGAPSTGAASGQNVQAYSQCIRAAAGDVTKMQKCSTLLNSGG